MKHEEDDEQIALIRFMQLYHPKVFECLLHIPNGGKRNIIEAARLKRMGVKPGVSDLFLAIPHNDFHGLWVEMKSKKGRPSKYQLEWIDLMRNQGYKAVICKGWESARNEILEYLKSHHLITKKSDSYA